MLQLDTHAPCGCLPFGGVSAAAVHEELRPLTGVSKQVANELSSTRNHFKVHMIARRCVNMVLGSSCSRSITGVHP